MGVVFYMTSIECIYYARQNVDQSVVTTSLSEVKYQPTVIYILYMKDAWKIAIATSAQASSVAIHDGDQQFILVVHTRKRHSNITLPVTG